MAKRDYYEVLGISKSASADEIKRAYRKLAHEHHPDKATGNNDKFTEVGEAYETLKDPQKRAQYDQFGHDGPFAGAGAGSGGGGYSQGFGGGFDVNDLGDIFETFFTGGGRQGGGRQRGRDMEVGIDLAFREAVFGVEKTIGLELQDTCDRCHGSTAEPGTKLVTCKTCSGQGQVTRVQNTILGSFRQPSVCPTCHGRGKQPETPCSKCRGTGVVRRSKQIKVKVPAGVDNGAVIRATGEGEASQSGQKGDLYVHVRVRADRQLTRKGYDITSEVKVPMTAAVLGVEVPIETLDGKVTLKVQPGTQSGQIIKLSNRGVPHLNARRRGDHLVKVNVEIPTKLTPRQKELLKEFADEKPKGFWK